MTNTRLGRIFGRLTVVDRHTLYPKDGNHAYLCRCECGSEKVVRWKNLIRGTTKSCGCLQNEWHQKMAEVKKARVAKKQEKYRAYLEKLAAVQPDGIPVTKHPLFNTWRCMQKRCHDPNHDKYQFYGAKGVTVCDRWRESFKAFVEDMGPKPTPRHTLDRKDGAKGYSPDNCRWATVYEQRSNTTSATPHLVTLFGKTYLLVDLCRTYNLDRDKIVAAIKSGIPSDVAFVEAKLRKELWKKTGPRTTREQWRACRQRAIDWLAKNSKSLAPHVV